MIFPVQMRQSNKCGGVRNDEIISLHLLLNMSLIVKYVQHVGIIWACSLPGVDLLIFSGPEGQNIAGLFFARDFSPQVDTMLNVTI